MGSRLPGLLLLFLALACAPEARQPVDGAASSGLVFVRRNATDADLSRVRIADAAERPLLETPDRDESWPYWSPAARRLVYESREGSAPDSTRLFLLDPASGQVEGVVPGGKGRQHWAAWAPATPRLAFVFTGSGGRPDAGIGLLDLATGTVGLAAVSNPRLRFIRPDFAPDGRRLVAQRTQDADQSTLWLLEPGAEPLRVTGRGFDHKPRFTRDAAWIVFTRRALRGAPGRLMQVRPDGRDAAQLADAPGADDHSGRPSPVRDEIAFISDRSGNREVFLVSLQGGPPRRLTHTPGRDELAPRWSPDGDHLALTTRPAGAPGGGVSPDTRVVVIDRQGEVLLEIAGTMPDWMPAWR